MNRRVNQIFVLSVIVLLSSISVFAKVRRENVKFAIDISVNGTLLKKGNYEVSFDDESRELSFVKGRKVVAKVLTRTEKAESKPESLQFSSVSNGGTEELVSVIFGGTDQRIILPRDGGHAAETK